jgi:hypothetical protein
MQYLARLLANPGVDLHVSDLTTGVPAPAGGTSAMDADLVMTGDLGDAGEMLDRKSRRDYQERIASLREEIEEARAMNDTGRVERAEGEIDFITQEISSAYGLGGRARRSANAVDRARKAVSSRVSDSIRRIRKEHPNLGGHLENSIRLGFFCRYAPEKPVTWDV